MRNQFSRRRLFYWCLVAAGIPLFCGDLYSANDYPDVIAQRQLRCSLNALANLSSISLETTNETWISPKITGARTFRSGTFSYLAAGNRHREIYTNTSTSAFISHWEVAFDGDKYAWLNGDQAYMLESKTDKLSDPVSPQNPLFANLEFLSPASDDCKACVLRLSQMSGYLSPTNTPSPLTVSATNNGGLLLVYPGRVKDENKSYWEVVLDTNAAFFKPVTMIRVISDGTRIAYDFLDYTNCNPSAAAGSVDQPAPISFPSLIQQWVTTPRDGLVVTGLTRLLRVSFPTGLSNRLFSLDESAAKTVFAADTMTFKKSNIDQHPTNRRPVTGAFLFILACTSAGPLAYLLYVKKRPRT